MTQEEIIKYNQMCAEFLGWDYNKFMDRWNEDMHHQYSFVESIELKFHEDWNWIMEVVGALEEKGSHVIVGQKLYSNFEITRYEIKFYFGPSNNYLLHLELKPYLSEEVWKHPMYKNHIIEAFDFKNRTKKEAVVHAIDLFLTWYNENKTN